MKLYDHFRAALRARAASTQRKHALAHRRLRRSRALAGERLEDRSMLATFTVTNTNDSGAGSLREAINNANANANADLIQFNIPASDPGHVYYRDDGVAGQVTLANVVPTTAPSDASIGDIDPDWAHSWWSIGLVDELPTINRTVTIDGYTQSGASTNTRTVESGLGVNTVLRVELNGANAGNAQGLFLSASDSTVRGLAVNRFNQNGIMINDDDNFVTGNFIGTDVSGMLKAANGVEGVFISNGGGNSLGGTLPADRNLISGNSSSIIIQGNQATGNFVQGNLLGTNAAGTASIPNSFNSLYVSAPGNTIGGSALGAGNVISGNPFNGIHIAGIFADQSGPVNADGNMVLGNRIGTTADGLSPLPNGGNGVFISDDAANTIVGGVAPGAGNIIAFNLFRGVLIGRHGDPSNPFPGEEFSDDGHTVRGNSIHSNGSLGIDLGDSFPFTFNGVTPNDSNDVDQGQNAPNEFQNFPVLTAAAMGGPTTNVQGSLNSRPNTTYIIDFYASPVADPTGFGEGKTYLGSANVTTNGSGNATFNTTLAVSVPAGQIITTTATDPAGNTSEFSQGPPNRLPVFTSPTSFNVDENNTAVGPVTATDADSQTVTFSVTGGVDSARFGITSGGVLSFNVAPNFEAPTDSGTNNIYNVQITASDGVGGTTIQSIAVTVLPVNDNSPIFTSNAAPSVNENVSAVIVVAATDADQPTQNVTFAKSGGVDQARFSLDSVTGALAFISSPDFENPNDADTNSVYLVQVTASDGQGSTAVQNLSVTVNPVNDNSPIFTTSATPSVGDKVSAVISVAATDADVPAQTVTLALTGGVDQTRLAFDSGSGALTFVTPPDFDNPTDADANNTYEVQVTASDGFGRSTVQNLVVTVRNTIEITAVVTSQRLIITGGDDVNQIEVHLGGDGSKRDKNKVRLINNSEAPTTINNLPVTSLDFEGILAGVLVQTAGGNDIIKVTGTNVKGPITLDGGTGGDTYIIATRKIKFELREAAVGEIDTLDFSGYLKTGAKVDLAKSIGKSQSLGRSNSLKLTGPVENVIGSPFKDSFKGNELSNTLTGNGGNDKLDGRAGNDTLLGGAGKDSLKGGAGNDLLDGGTEDDKLDGGDGEDSLLGGAGKDSLKGSAGNDKLNGGSEDDKLDGGLGNDILRGGTGNDSLKGNDGNDALLGGEGDDTLAAKIGFDLLIGGIGLDKLTGGSKGNSILIGGSSDTNDNDTALQAILAEWSSAADIGTRISNLQTGAGPLLNGVKLVTTGSPTVIDDLTAETLKTKFGNNWIFTPVGDEHSGFKTGDILQP